MHTAESWPATGTASKSGPDVIASVNAPITKQVLHLAPLRNDDWALEAELRSVQRLIASLKGRDSLGQTTNPPLRLEPDSVPRPATNPATPQLAQPRSHTLAWLILSLGLTIFACGAMLLGWSVVGNRADLWTIGMPLTLIGQAGLILGLVLQLDGLWTSSRSTAAALNELDGELKHVHEATKLLSAPRSGGPQSFYLHLAEGASPHLLLADLKGQMDTLAHHMARQS